MIAIPANAWLAVLTLTGGFATATACAGAEIEVDLQLVLAADVSGSMGGEEESVQRQGHVGAFRHPEVVRAILSGPLGRVAVAYVEWSGSRQQSVVVPWTILSDLTSVEAFAHRLAAAPEEARGSHTAVSSALLFAAGQFASSGVRSTRRLIDISGDGIGDQGPPMPLARDELSRRRITVNGLSFHSADSDAGGPYAYLHASGDGNVHAYYRDEVIGGPGAFAIAVDDPDDFAAAIRRKLVLEIAWR
jgi:hypothetical protein